MGSPDNVAAQIVKSCNRVGMSHAVMSKHWQTLEGTRSMEAMEPFAAEAFPRMRHEI